MSLISAISAIYIKDKKEKAVCRQCWVSSLTPSTAGIQPFFIILLLVFYPVISPAAMSSFVFLKDENEDALRSCLLYTSDAADE